MKILSLGVFVGSVAGCHAPPTISPIAPPPSLSGPALATPSNPALAAAQQRVNQVGYKLVSANGEAIQNLQPAWTVVPGDTPGLRCEGDHAQLSLGLVHACATEGQLAAVMSWSVGRMQSQRQARLTDNAAAAVVPPPETFRFGNDGSGFDAADPMFQAQYRRELELYKQRKQAQQPPPEPMVVAQQVLVQAGFSMHEFDQVKNLIPDMSQAK